MKTSLNQFAIKKIKRRKGVAMILAIIVLIFSASICLSMVRTTSLRQQRFENRMWKVQTELIADSAIDRVYQQLLKDHQYSGEVWKVTTNEEQGSATISVTPESSQKYKVNIIAVHPVDSPTRSQSTLDVVIDLNHDLK